MVFLSLVVPSNPVFQDLRFLVGVVGGGPFHPQLHHLQLDLNPDSPVQNFRHLMAVPTQTQLEASCSWPAGHTRKAAACEEVALPCFRRSLRMCCALSDTVHSPERKGYPGQRAPCLFSGVPRIRCREHAFFGNTSKKVPKLEGFLFRDLEVWDGAIRFFFKR